MDMIVFLQQVGMKDVAKVGGKNASLGEMLQHLARLGIRVPGGFATTVDAYHFFLQKNRLDQRIAQELKKLNVNNVKQLRKSSHKIQQWILQADLPQELVSAIKQAFKKVQLKKHSFAIRSSATAEDLAEASFAGQQASFLNVKGIAEILIAIKKVFASLFTPRAISYRTYHAIAHEKVGISVAVQTMVRSDLSSSGVMFTIDTESGFDKVVLINASYGLGEAVVQGLVNPDEFYVYKPTLMENKMAIIRREVGEKKVKMVYGGKNKSSTIKLIKVPEKKQQQFCIEDKDILLLAKQAVLIEKHYGKPMDIEWAKDGINGKIYIVQARPETVKSRDEKQFIERYHLSGKGKIKTTGRSVGQKIGQGVARIILNSNKMHQFRKGEILVTDMTDPDWEPIMKLAAAIVTNRGGRTCHAAIVARELGIPAVVGCGDATEVIKEKEKLTVSCAEGEVGHVYEGLLPFKQEKISITDMPKIPVRLCMNLGSPEKAFGYQHLPNSGVGLARLEFIIGNTIGVHPNALLNFKKLPRALKKKIQNKIAAYASPKEFYIEKLAEGIATIAAAFYPKEVVFRFSDFKSNEYANLLGGELFEPKEENPMIGFRGASRYVGASFRECFALECEAFKRVREKMGLTNAQVMVPFARTIEELKQVVELCEKYGLKRGDLGLKIYMMCEIPSNALLAEEFLCYCDGFSIGSNDLTQLTLGLDRDSGLVAHLFEEKNAAVKKLLQMAITACNRANKYIGICGQAPSDHPDIAQWLMEQGIQAISLTPDTIVATWMFLAAHQK